MNLDKDNGVVVFEQILLKYLGPSKHDALIIDGKGISHAIYAPALNLHIEQALQKSK